MKNILYPLIASALVTIVPFLLSFEKGQDIIHGLVCFEIFALLLLFVNIRESTNRYKKIAIAFLAFVLVVVSYWDVQGIMLYKGGKVGLYGAIPLITIAFAIVMMKPVKAMPLNTILFTLFVGLLSHFLVDRYLPYGQPLFEFPAVKAFARLAPYTPPRNVLPGDFRNQYGVTDSVTITKNFIDTSKSNVVILVESWGIPMDTSLFNRELAIFKESLTHSGVHFRMYSRTRTAEREDLLDSSWRKETGGRDSLFIPAILKIAGFKTTFLFGGDSLIHHRDRYVKKMGFDYAVFSDSDIVDHEMILKVDSLLQDTSTRQMIAWTTRDTRFPVADEAEIVYQLYFDRLFGTLQLIADLAKKYPNVRFIVQGDHEPILAPEEFMQKFYHRWVSYVILN